MNTPNGPAPVLPAGPTLGLLIIVGDAFTQRRLMLRLAAAAPEIVVTGSHHEPWEIRVTPQPYLDPGVWRRRIQELIEAV